MSVSSDLQSQIQAGKCVDLKRLLAKSFLDNDEDTLCLFDNLGRPVQKSNRKPLPDLNIDQWSSAFHMLMSVYLERHPHCLQGMLAYAELIRGAARDSPGNAWSLYDQQFRSRLQADPSRPWGMIDSQLWLQYFCKTQSVQTSKTTSDPQIAKTKQPRLCFFFNRSSGCYREGCCYAHFCSNCGSPSHAVLICPLLGKPAQTTPSGGAKLRQLPLTSSFEQPFRFGTGRKSNYSC